MENNTAIKTKKFWRGIGLGFAFFGIFLLTSQLIGGIIAAVYQMSYIMREGFELPSSGADMFGKVAEVMEAVPGLGTVTVIGLLVGWVLTILAIPLFYKLIKINKMRQRKNRFKELFHFVSVRQIKSGIPPRASEAFKKTVP